VADVHGSECFVEKTANTPGSYEFLATMVVDGVEYKTSKTLTIKKPDNPDRGPPREGCLYWFPHNCGEIHWTDAICRECHNWWGINYWDEGCKRCTDPQTCADEKLKTQASASNVCCIYDSADLYSPGPENGPACLSPDTNTHNYRTINWWYGGKDCHMLGCWAGEYWGVENTRNVLVQDSEYAKFKYDECEDDDDCTGRSGGANPPSSLSSAKCINKRCKLSDSLPTYTSWLYIRISETSRPVYGVAVRGIYTGPCGEFHVFLHDNSGWFDIGGAHLNQWIWLRASDSGKWSWENIDSMLLVQADNCHPKWEVHIDYVGLLTKDGRTTFCTDGTGDYNRVVDDGKTCYWGLDCPITNSKGWKWKETAFIGPLKDKGCDCSSGTCGNGYCEFSVEGERFCYYDVKCMHGGWNGILEKCDAGKTCRYDGCK
jgi:hypothetical protein